MTTGSSLSHTQFIKPVHTDTQYPHRVIIKANFGYFRRFQPYTLIGFSLLKDPVRKVCDRPGMKGEPVGLLRAVIGQSLFPHILSMTVILISPSVRPQQLDSKTIAHKNTFCSLFLSLSHPSVTFSLSFICS